MGSKAMMMTLVMLMILAVAMLMAIDMVGDARDLRKM